MHIPDGFIAPKMYLPAYVVAVGLWLIGLRRARRILHQDVIPMLAVLTAAAFVLMMVAVPLPGGTSAHATGVALLAIRFGVWAAFLSVSLVLVVQAVLVGVGGVTALPINALVNALAVGLVGSVVAAGSFFILRRVSEAVALFVAGWLSVAVPALLVATALGVQPAIAHAVDGTPLFFPFGLRVTLPAVLGPHLLLGIGEGVLTVVAYRFLERIQRTVP
jgi:cobalt/nickel transport system permease protein